MINKQINEFDQTLINTMMSGIRHRSVGEVTTITRQYQALTFTQHALPAFYLPLYTAQIKDQVFFF